MRIALTSPLKRSHGETDSTFSYEGRKVYKVESDSLRERGVHKNFDTPFSETERNVCKLLARTEGWNGPDSPRPDLASIEKAYSWYLQLYRNIRADLWIRPRVSSDEYGDVTFEWWKDQKKLTVYVSPETVEYVKVDKSNSSLEMDDGTIESSKESSALWHWLTS